jgi:hypothetical protein
VPTSGGCSLQRNVDPTHQSCYVAFTEVIKVLTLACWCCIPLYWMSPWWWHIGAEIWRGLFMIAYECILLSEWFVWCHACKNMHSKNNVKFITEYTIILFFIFLYSSNQFLFLLWNVFPEMKTKYITLCLCEIRFQLMTIQGTIWVAGAGLAYTV